MSDASSATRKVFVGIKVPEATTSLLHGFSRTSLVETGGIRWSNPDDLHITLEFLGEVSATKIADLIMKLKGVRCPPFEAKISGAEIFRDARVLVADIERSHELISLQTTVVDVLSVGNSLADRTAYRPHITVGRWSPSALIAETHLESLKNQLNQYCKEPGTNRFFVDEFILYETVAGRYRILERFSLQSLN
jgi:2'-5' RNA ligase